MRFSTPSVWDQFITWREPAFITVARMEGYDRYELLSRGPRVELRSSVSTMTCALAES
jgi:hypothetical protein